ncbi:unnamed protein product [Protopolystoma xenopodis]|uniref:Uncharacterized protein n=1 Tax=Protopolystoma xenopodis TaxID=117903 RepID=A0A448X3A3_9PLAT|nr:unnamed protein product [Protopolystoma xenopodis]
MYAPLRLTTVNMREVFESEKRSKKTGQLSKSLLATPDNFECLQIEAKVPFVVSVSCYSKSGTGGRHTKRHAYMQEFWPPHAFAGMA